MFRCKMMGGDGIGEGTHGCRTWRHITGFPLPTKTFNCLLQILLVDVQPYPCSWTLDLEHGIHGDSHWVILEG